MLFKRDHYIRTSRGCIYSATISERIIPYFAPFVFHFTPDVFETFHENYITFACFLPNSIHLCQPQYVCFFRQFKESWKNIFCTSKMINKNAKNIPNLISLL